MRRCPIQAVLCAGPMGALLAAAFASHPWRCPDPVRLAPALGLSAHPSGPLFGGPGPEWRILKRRLLAVALLAAGAAKCPPCRFCSCAS